MYVSLVRPGRLFEAAQHGDWRPWLRLRGRGRRTAPSSQPTRAGCPWFYGVLKCSWGEISRRNRSTSSRCGRQLFAPIPSLRSCSAYRPAARRNRIRQMACAKDDNGSGTCVGYCRTLRLEARARVRSRSGTIINTKGAREGVTVGRNPKQGEIPSYITY